MNKEKLVTLQNISKIKFRIKCGDKEKGNKVLFPNECLKVDRDIASKLVKTYPNSFSILEDKIESLKKQTQEKIDDTDKENESDTDKENKKNKSKRGRPPIITPPIPVVSDTDKENG